MLMWNIFYVREKVKWEHKVPTMCRSNLFRYICKESLFFLLRIGEASVKLFCDVYCSVIVRTKKQ